MVAFNRLAGYRSATEQTLAELNAISDLNAELDRPPKAVPYKPAEYHRRDLIALAWGVSLLVAGMLGWVARGNQ